RGNQATRRRTSATWAFSLRRRATDPLPGQVFWLASMTLAYSGATAADFDRLSLLAAIRAAMRLSAALPSTGTFRQYTDRAAGCQNRGRSGGPGLAHSAAARRRALGGAAPT